MNKSFKVFLVVLVGLFVIAVDLFIVNGIARSDFMKKAQEQMKLHTSIRRLEFEANMNEQLTLVKQMVKTPLIVNHLIEPANPTYRQLAFDEFQAFKSSFLSDSVFWISDTNLEFWTDMEFSYMLNPNDPGEYWYNMTLNETDLYNFNINYNENLNKTMLWVNVVVRNENQIVGGKGKPVGVVGTGIPVQDFIDLMYKDVPEGSVMYLFNDLDEITGSLDATILKDKLSIYDTFPYLKEVEEKPNEITFYTTRDGVYLLAPLPLLRWHIAMYTPYTTSAFFDNSIRPFFVSLGIILLVVLSSITILSMHNQLSILKDAVAELSSGKADLTKRVAIKGRTVFKIFTDLVDEVNRFLIKFHGIIDTIKQSEQKLATVGSDMESSMEDTQSAISNIISNIQTVHSQIENQLSNVHETAGAVNEISSDINSLEKMILGQSDGVALASSAIEEMVANISNVNNSVDMMAVTFSDLEKEIVSGKEKQKAVNDKIDQIEEKSKMLQEANSTITDIARQTNLLAMNAAIEASHAGDAGRGFSVVADEIRKLSETSSVQSKTISEQLKSIQQSISEVVNASQESTKSFVTVSREISRTNQIVQQIKLAMAEQTKGSKQVIETLYAMNSSTSDVANASMKMTDGNKQVLQNIGGLQDSSRLMKESMDNMASGAERVNLSSDELERIATKMKHAISEIAEIMSQFKV